MIRSDQAAFRSTQAVDTKSGGNDTPKENDLHRRDMIYQLDEDVRQKKGDRREEHRPDAGRQEFIIFGQSLRIGSFEDPPQPQSAAHFLFAENDRTDL